MLEAIHAKIRPGVKLVLINDVRGDAAHESPFAAEYESMLDRASPSFDFPQLAEDTRATTFYTTGTTGLPKGVYYSHRQLVLHTLAVATALANAPHATFTARDVYMPITPMFHVHAWGLPYVATLLGVKQVYPGRYVPDVLLGLIAPRRRHVLALRADDPADDARQARPLQDVDLGRWKVIIGGSALPIALARAAVERGIDVIAGYGMSETCPILTLAHLRPHMSEWDVERVRAVPLPRRPADPVRAVAHRRRRDERRGARRRQPGRSRRALAVAHAGLSRTSPSARRSCGAAAGCIPATSASSTPTAI